MNIKYSFLKEGLFSNKYDNNKYNSILYAVCEAYSKCLKLNYNLVIRNTDKSFSYLFKISPYGKKYKQNFSKLSLMDKVKHTIYMMFEAECMDRMEKTLKYIEKNHIYLHGMLVEEVNTTMSIDDIVKFIYPLCKQNYVL